MKIVKLKGGLGNQLFQYTFAKLIEKKTNDTVKLDLSTFEDLKGDIVRVPRLLKYNISLEVATKDEIKEMCIFSHFGNSQSNLYRLGIAIEGTINKRYLFERNHSGATQKQMSQCTFFDGYWQNYKFVDFMMEEIDKDFIPKYSISDDGKRKLELIKNTQSVFVGIRRGDYLTTKPNHYGTFDQAYYDQAMEIIATRISNPLFFIFSNDINWVKANMDFSKYKVKFMENTVDDFEDFLLMTECSHSIIPNSTFHWWGARRHENPNKIIVAPKKWFADDAFIEIIPERWERV